jgi:hypothetical protein
LNELAGKVILIITIIIFGPKLAPFGMMPQLIAHKEA